MSDIFFNCPRCNASLQVDASQAGSQTQCPGCRQIITPPARSTSPANVSTPYSKTPTSLLVFGVLAIAFAGMAILGMPFQLFSMGMLISKGGGLGPYVIFAAFSSLIGLLLSIWLLITGIGLIRKKAWAPGQALLYAKVQITVIILASVVNVIMFLTGVFARIGENFPGFEVGAGIGILISLVSLIFPILMIIYMGKPEIQHACNA